MTMNELERQVWRSAQVVANNPKLKKKEVVEWTSGRASPVKGEVAFLVSVMGTNWSVCILKEHDKRTDEVRAAHDKAYNEHNKAGS